MIPSPRAPHGDESPPPLDTAAMTLEDLRRQRRLLTGELRGVRYWRRIAQAQTDLLVAGLVYHGREDVHGLHTDGRCGQAATGAGERLLRLRERARLMAVHEHALRRDLDAVTRELADRLSGPAALSSPGQAR